MSPSRPARPARAARPAVLLPALVALVAVGLGACAVPGASRSAGRDPSGRFADRTDARRADDPDGTSVRGGDDLAARGVEVHDEEVDCARMLAFVGTDVVLPGEPRCRMTGFTDTLYEAHLAADPADVVAWLAAVRPDAVLPEAVAPAVCRQGVDRCVQVARAAGDPGAWHYLEVEVTGTGPDAVVRVAAFTT